MNCVYGFKSDRLLDGKITAEAERITTVASDLSTETQQRTAAIQSEQQARVAKDNELSESITAQANRVDTVISDLSDETNNRTSAIQIEQQARVSADEALGTQINSVKSDLSDESTERKAAIQSEQQARVQGDNALASNLNTVQTTIGEHTASIQSLSETSASQSDDIGSIKAQYTFKLDVDGYVSGYTSINDGDQSSMIFRQDVFAVGAPGKTSLTFVIDGEKVVMDGASIKDATIESAAIKKLNVEKINGDVANFLRTHITDGFITNAMIGNEIKSDNYVAGQSGWIIKK
ncbi:phage tail tip fiber protein [Endozoicomonas arenosclerae]|uniref:phage tail tip fiber protein n=1 Tax=Endozoicomonas arenosclerae TaxID=1633495 RepID=UPI0007836D54|nr:hypothetical protein [Endozoicomonas arenosclerae]